VPKATAAILKHRMRRADVVALRRRGVRARAGGGRSRRRPHRLRAHRAVLPDDAPRHRPAAGVGDGVDRLAAHRGGQRFANVEALDTAKRAAGNRLGRYEAGERAPVAQFLRGPAAGAAPGAMRHKRARRPS
jgi:hypothetical protein